jgi:hypothetical protein
VLSQRPAFQPERARAHDKCNMLESAPCMKTGRHILGACYCHGRKEVATAEQGSVFCCLSQEVTMKQNELALAVRPRVAVHEFFVDVMLARLECRRAGASGLQH